MTAAAPLPDARPDNWVDRLAPRPLRPWLKLGRFDRPVGTWLLLLPGWQGLALASAMQRRLAEWRLFVLFAIGAAVMRAAGCAYNDIVDRDIDAKVARTARRPIPSGQVSVAQAWGFIALCCLAGFAVLLTMNLAAIALGVLSLGLIAAYPFMKRITWWPQAWLGLTFNWGALLGFAAVQGRIAAPAALLYASGIFWTLGYDTIYALQDSEDDALVGVKSSARRLGSHVRPGVAAFYAVCALLALVAGIASRPGMMFYPAWALYAAHLAWQVFRLDRQDGARALKLFRSNRDAGLILVFGFLLSLWSAA